MIYDKTEVTSNLERSKYFFPMKQATRKETRRVKCEEN
jgi:hypothetical protein